MTAAGGGALNGAALQKQRFESFTEEAGRCSMSYTLRSRDGLLGCALPLPGLKRAHGPAVLCWRCAYLCSVESIMLSSLLPCHLG